MFLLLVLTFPPRADRALDNLAIDANGALWAAGKLAVYSVSPNNMNKLV